MSRGTRVFRRLMRLYPRDFRERFAPEMLALFEERHAAAAPGPAGAARFWCVLFADVVVSAARERLPQGVPIAGLGHDLRQARRMASRTPLLTAFVVILMALAIGTTTTAFSIVEAVLLRPYPFAAPGRVVTIWERRGPEELRNTVAGHEFPEWKARSRSFEAMAAIAFDRDYTLTGEGEPLKLVAARVTSDFFRVFDERPLLGRGFLAEEDQPGYGTVVVIGEVLWRTRFAADPGVVGRHVALNGVPHTVVGVMPADFTFPPGPAGASPDIWTPIAEPIHLYRGRHYLFVAARLRDGVNVAAAQADLDTVAARLEQELPQFNRGHGVNVQPLERELARTFRPMLLIAFVSVTLVLIVGCCNVANLLLARAASRQQEMALRVALGAGRMRVARQLFAEGALLAGAGGAAGLLIASWLIGAVRTAGAGQLPRLQQAALDPVAAAFACAITMGTAVVFGLVPLTQLLRVPVADRLQHGARGAAAPVRQPVRRALVIAEVALTVTIATGAGLFIQSLHGLLRVNPGFTAAGVMALDVALPQTRYASAPRQRAFFDEALGRLGALPGIAAAAAANLAPQDGGRAGIAIAIEGAPPPRPGDEPSAAYRIVSADYFKTLRTPFVSGRAFTPSDRRVAVPVIRWFPQQPQPAGFNAPQPPPVAVINEAMARRFWPAVDPLGRRFRVLFSPPITVIGVIRDTRDEAIAEAPRPEFYLSDAQEPQSRMTILLRAAGSMEALPAAARASIWTIDPDLPVSNLRTLSEIVDGNVAGHRAIAWLVGGFAAISLVLMTFGVYAVVSYTALQRTYEIGVRLALGAQRRDVRQLVVTSGLGLGLAGVVVGLPGGYVLARLASSLLYEVTPADPLTYAAMATLVLGITMAATWVPAARAQRVNPVTVLRSE